MALSLAVTASGVSNTPSLTKPSCLGKGAINLEMGTNVEGPGDDVYASIVNAMVGAWSTPNTGTILCGKILKCVKLFQWNVEEKYIVTHLVLVVVVLSELESIDDEVGAHDEWREDSFPLKDPTGLGMRLIPCGLSLNIMIVRRESHGFRLPTIALQCKFYIHIRIDTFNYAIWILRWRLR